MNEAARRIIRRRLEQVNNSIKSYEDNICFHLERIGEYTVNQDQLKVERDALNEALGE